MEKIEQTNSPPGNRNNVGEYDAYERIVEDIIISLFSSQEFTLVEGAPMYRCVVQSLLGECTLG